jgi:hypothetical protein
MSRSNILNTQEFALADLPNPAVRVLPEQAILDIAKVLPYRTSCHLNWAGVEVHRYRLSPGGNFGIGVLVSATGNSSSTRR